MLPQSLGEATLALSLAALSLQPLPQAEWYCSLWLGSLAPRPEKPHALVSAIQPWAHTFPECHFCAGSPNSAMGAQELLGITASTKHHS